MFWKIKSKEYKELENKITELEMKVSQYRRKVETLDVDLSACWDKINKFNKRKIPKADEDEEGEEGKDLIGGVLLPENGSNSALSKHKKQ